VDWSLWKLVNVNWDRWIISSLSDYFRGVAESIPFSFFIEGQIRPTTINDFAEIRFNGPHWNEISCNTWKMDIYVAILVQIVQDDQDIYWINRLTGNFSSAFKKTLPIYKYGDDDSQLMCINLVRGREEKIRVERFGVIKAATPVVQASVEAHYQNFILL
jgi:hypothetical protein